MTNQDVKIVSKLERLNVFLQEKLETADAQVAYWESKVEEWGKSTTTIFDKNKTYGDCLNTAIENKKYCEREMQENKALIKELRKGDEDEN